jgi:hypothetical protein
VWGLALLSIFLFSRPAEAKYGGGSGTAEDPYQIATAADLIALGEDPNDYGRHFILTADIDLEGHVFDKAVIAPDTDPNDMFSQFQGTAFTGVLDGDGHTISHLTITGADYLGLFGQLASAAEVKDLGVLDANVTSWGGPVGGMVGSNSGRITNCYSIGRVSSPLYVGGLIGRNGGVVTQCCSTGAVSGAYDAGGVMGENSGTVTQCYSTSTVSGTGNFIGGLVGDNDRGTVTRCYSTGAVNGRERVGGLIGGNTGAVTDCYSAGRVGGTGQYGTVGGLVGWEAGGDVTNCFWDIQTSGQAEMPWSAGIGKTTAQMHTASTFLIWATCGNAGVWTIDEGNDYPRLWWEQSNGELISGEATLAELLMGEGTPDNPYLICTAEQLDLVGLFPCEWDKHFRLTADIDLDPNLPDGVVFNQAVIPTFTGVFDGNGHTISHLTIQGGSYLGLFGQLESMAEIRDLGVTYVNVNSTGSFVGGLVGSNGSWDTQGGTVADCYSTGVVSGTSYVGGLVGNNYGTLTQCYSTDAVSGTGQTGQIIGGLVGSNSGNIATSYSTGTVSGMYTVGGLVGGNHGDVTYCYSSGAVTGIGRVGGLLGYNENGSVTSSFWDTQTSDQTTSGGGIGKTTAQMQMASTFLDAGWGMCNKGIWTVDDGRDYPRLRWENKPGDPLDVRLSEFLSGEGTADSPYLIDTAEGLNLVALFPCEWDKHFKVMADIDMSGFDGREGRPAFNIIAPDTHTAKSGFQGTAFTGVFDGNGHTISHLTITGKDYLGLFGYLASGADVKNLGVVDLNIAGSGSYIGGLVGFNHDGTVTQCYSTGAVSGTYDVGGLMGWNYWGTVTQCYSTGTASGRSNIGGLVGYSNGVINNCYSLASAKADNYVGGLAGRSYGRITNCYSSGTVVGNDHFGGLLGHGGGSVTGCFWDTQTSGQATSAGGTGKTTSELQMAVTFLGWGCTPAVWTVDEGVDYPRIAWEGKPGKALPGLGDFVAGSGRQDDPYLIHTAEQLNMIGLIPCDLDKHFSLMGDIDLSAYTGTAFNTLGSESTPFTGVFDGNDHTISNFSYTCTGTYNIGLFGYISGPNSLVKNLKLTWPDINAGMGGNVGALVGSIISGTIANCHIDGGSVSGGSQVGGLVGTSYQGTISGCNSTATVSGNGSVGGLVGLNHGTITRCYSAGRVLGDYDVGGLVGTNGCLDCGRRGHEEPGMIYDSYSTAAVLGTGSNCGGLVGSNDLGEVARCYASGIVLGASTVGGLAGCNGDKISSCYSTGDVGGEKDVGGLVGLNSAWWIETEGTIANCYSTGIVLGDEYVGGLVGEGDANDVVASFWDIGTSGQEMSAGGTGKTTTEMQSASTFLDANWDFVGESQNGTEDVWAICEGIDYPHLAWEFVIGDFDDDADTDFADFCIFAERWLAADGSFWCGDGGTDLTNDGNIDFADLKVLSDNWLERK